MVSIILSAGLSIVDSAYKEIVLASTVRNSIQALYVADSGTECTFYWDNVRGNPDETSYYIPEGAEAVTRDIFCGGNRLKISVVPASAGSVAQMWYRESEGSDAPCAYITVNSGNPDMFGVQSVAIDSWGINSCNPTFGRRTDRALHVGYTRY